MFSKNKTILGNYQYVGNNLIHKVSNFKFQLQTKAIKSDNRLRLINYLVETATNEFFCQLNAVLITKHVECYKFDYDGLEYKLRLNKITGEANLKNGGNHSSKSNRITIGFCNHYGNTLNS